MHNGVQRHQRSFSSKHMSVLEKIIQRTLQAMLGRTLPGLTKVTCKANNILLRDMQKIAGSDTGCMSVGRCIPGSSKLHHQCSSVLDHKSFFSLHLSTRHRLD